MNSIPALMTAQTLLTYAFVFFLGIITGLTSFILLFCNRDEIHVYIGRRYASNSRSPAPTILEKTKHGRTSLLKLLTISIFASVCLAFVARNEARGAGNSDVTSDSKATSDNSFSPEDGYTSDAKPVVPVASTSMHGPENLPKMVFSLPKTSNSVGKRIALTFDDGPTRRTPEILAVLQEEEVKATFFILGEKLLSKTAAETLKKLHITGQSIGNHSITHTNFSDLSEEEIINEISGCNTLIKNILGSQYRPSLLRIPYGLPSDPSEKKRLTSFLSTLPLSSILWDVDSSDWRPETTGDFLLKHCLRNARDGSILLFHDTPSSALTPEVLKKLIQNFKSDGFEFVTL